MSYRKKQIISRNKRRETEAKKFFKKREFILGIVTGILLPFIGYFLNTYFQNKTYCNARENIVFSKIQFLTKNIGQLSNCSDKQDSLISLFNKIIIKDRCGDGLDGLVEAIDKINQSCFASLGEEITTTPKVKKSPSTDGRPSNSIDLFFTTKKYDLTNYHSFEMQPRLVLNVKSKRPITSVKIDWDDGKGTHNNYPFSTKKIENFEVYSLENWYEKIGSRDQVFVRGEIIFSDNSKINFEEKILFKL